MVNNVTALTSSGLRDWFIQRVSSIIIALYAIFLLGYLLCHPQLDYATWRSLFSHSAMRIFSFLTLVSIVVHTWVGLWTVFTDYVKQPVVQTTSLVIIILALLAGLAWGVQILWN